MIVRDLKLATKLDLAAEPIIGPWTYIGARLTRLLLLLFIRLRILEGIRVIIEPVLHDNILCYQVVRVYLDYFARVMALRIVASFLKLAEADDDDDCHNDNYHDGSDDDNHTKLVILIIINLFHAATISFIRYILRA